MSAYVKLGFKKLNNHSAYYPHFGYSYVVENWCIVSFQEKTLF